ncbi:MAG TPA: NAD(P)-dependent oxidoreductase [Acidimicrobiales bacterium]|nr:NAD(P)-dependent oxidoreductase [Acidimicrobiales bacterium]
MILVTGGMGFIGLHTAHRLAEAGESVLITRFRRSRTPEFLDPYLESGRVQVTAMDVSDPFSVLEAMAAHRVTSVLHLAVPGLGADPVGREIEVNVGGLRNVLESARALGVRRVTMASSVAVYAGVGDGPWREDDPLPVASPSATSAFKKAEEILALHYAERTGTDVCCVRIGVVYGPLYHSLSNLPSRLAHAAVRPGTQLPPRPSVPGARRDLADLIYVRDCAAALRLVHLAEARRKVYNLGGGRAVPDSDVAAAVARAVPGWVAPEPGPDAVGDDGPRYMDLTAIAELGFEPRYSLDEGVADYVEWLRDHDL